MITLSTDILEYDSHGCDCELDAMDIEQYDDWMMIIKIRFENQ